MIEEEDTEVEENRPNSGFSKLQFSSTGDNGGGVVVVVAIPSNRGFGKALLSSSTGKTCSEDVKTRPSSGFSNSSMSSGRGDNSALRSAPLTTCSSSSTSILSEEEGVISLSSSPPLTTS